jgi:hypothetical protein
MKTNSGARYEIAIDGTARSHRDRKELAIEAATFLKNQERSCRGDGAQS